MPNFRVVAIFLIVFFTFACSKKDPVVPASCIYLGKGYKVNYSSTHEEESSSDILVNEMGLLTEATVTLIGTGRDFSSGVEDWRKIYQRKYNFVYDKEGFLKKQITTKSNTSKSKISAYYGNKGPFKVYSSVTTESTEFTYASGNVLSTLTTIDSSIIGDDRLNEVTTFHNNRMYSYDGNGSLLSSTENFDNGDVLITTYNEGVRTSDVFTSKSGQKRTINYNRMNLPTEQILRDATYKTKYDERGNMVSVEQIINNITQYLYEFKYEDHTNPETLIPSKFQGIPDPIRTVHSSDGVNNLVEEKFTDYIYNRQSVSQFMHTYNGSGYPETTSIDLDSGQGIISKVTNYRYEKCPD